MPKPFRHALPSMLVWGLWLAAQDPALPRPRPVEDLSLEELGDFDITSVLKRPDRLAHAPAAVFVITRDDIRRSGATTLPELLALAPNLQVVQGNASQFTIGARGLNASIVNKLLVLIDGRTLYTALHAGVFWDAQDILLEDIERIEVISGPGGALWGSNAVNGVINILTRSSRDTAGTLVTTGLGTEDRMLAGVRHGGRLSEQASYRVYAKYLDRDDTSLASGRPGGDGWHRLQGGFRVDWATGQDTFTLQGDAYRSLIHQPVAGNARVDGVNLLGKWGRTFTPNSNLDVQLYFDRTHRDFPSVYGESVTTFDLDITHRFRLGGRQEWVWGGGYRSSLDDVTNSALLSFLPAQKELRLVNLFGQDTITLLPDRLSLTLGAKLEHNVYTGWEFQPSARLAYTPQPNHLFWAAISRAVRTPSRLDRDFFVDLPPILVLKGGPDFRSETVVAYEAGYRAQPSSRVSWSISPFYNAYRDLRTLEVSAQVLGNKLHGHTYGAECWGDLQVTEHWRLKPGYAFLRTRFRLLPDSTDPIGPSSAGNDARHRFQLTSHWTVTPNLDVDGTLHHVSALPDPAVPAHWNLNLRLGWRLSPQLEFSLIGRNLLNRRHPEFGPATGRHEIERGGMARVRWTF